MKPEISLYIITYLHLSLLHLGDASSCDVNGNDWAYNEKLDFTSRKRIITSSSCPNHFSKCQDSVCSGPLVTRANHHAIYFELPLFPVMAREQVDTTCINGTIAIALNGVSIESMSTKAAECVRPEIGGQSVGDKSCDIAGEKDATRVCGDAVVQDGKSFDKCGGHVDDRGLYHYHVPPTCLLSQLSLAIDAADTSSQHSPQIGWALDGFPVYGPTGPLGVLMRKCGMPGAHPVFCVDECNGLYSELSGVDAYMYRYYTTGSAGSGQCSAHVENAGNCTRAEEKCCVSAVPTPDFQPYTIGCFKGCRYDQPNCLASELAATTDYFYPVVSTPLSGVFGPQTHSPSSGGGGDGTTSGPTPSPQPAVDVFQEYGGYGITAVRLESRALGVIRTHLDGEPHSEVSEFAVGPDDAYITGLSLGYRANSEDDSELIFATQNGLYSMTEAGQELTKIVAGVKTIMIEGYNFGSTTSDIKFVAVKGQNCSYLRLVDSNNVECMLTHLATSEQVEDSDVTLATSSATVTGVHLQPLTIARGQSRRAVVAQITTSTLHFVPYGVAYAQDAVEVAPSARNETFMYWSDIGARRLYRCLANGFGVEVVLENVHRAYGVAVVLLTDGNQHVYYVDAKRGVLGRLHVSATERGEAIAAGSSQDVIVLKDLQEPRGLTVDTARGLLILTLFDGVVYKIRLDEASVVSSAGVDAAASLSRPSTAPFWVSRILRARTSSRFDGVGIIPMPSLSPSHSWNEQSVIIPDTSGNSLHFVSEDSFTSSLVSVYDGLGSKAVVWPRSIAVRRSYSPGDDSTAVVFVGELLGRIWRIGLDLSEGSTKKISVERVGLPVLLMDMSDFAASTDLRKTLHARKSIERSRSLQVFPDILD